MDSLKDKISCTRCKRLLDDEPKILPGCLHLFCLACLDQLPIALTELESEECPEDSWLEESSSSREPEAEFVGGEVAVETALKPPTAAEEEPSEGWWNISNNSSCSSNDHFSTSSLTASGGTECSDPSLFKFPAVMSTAGVARSLDACRRQHSFSSSSGASLEQSRSLPSAADSLSRSPSLSEHTHTHRPKPRSSSLMLSTTTSDHHAHKLSSQKRLQQPDDSSSSLLSNHSLSVACPKCRRVSVLPPGGFRHLPTSHVTVNVATAYKQARALHEKLRPHGEPLTTTAVGVCGLCVEKTPASGYCVTCGHLICADHLKCHRIWKREYGSHRFLTTDALCLDNEAHTVGLLSRSLRLGELGCPVHSHESNSLYKFFCSSCQDLACTFCTLSTHRDGPSHACSTVTPEFAAEKRHAVVEALERLDALVHSLDSLAGEVETRHELVTKKADGIKGKIDAVFTEIIDTLNSRKQSLFDKVDARVKAPLQKLKSCADSVDELREHVMESRNFVQENLNCEGELGLLSAAQVISEHSLGVEKEYRELLPGIKVGVPEIDFTEHRDYLCNCIASFGTVTQFGRLVGAGEGGDGEEGEEEVVTGTKRVPIARVQMIPPSLYQKLCELKTLTRSHAALDSSLDSISDVFSANLMDSLTGTYVYPPPLLPPATSSHSSSSSSPSSSPSPSSTRSSHSDITAKPGKTSSPRVFPKVAGIHVRTLGGLSMPSGVSVDGASLGLTACEFGRHQVVSLDQRGKEAWRIGRQGTGKGQFTYPQSTVRDGSGNILVVDSLYRIQVFDRSGRFLKSVGSKGKGKLQFKDPVSIVLLPPGLRGSSGSNRHVFVCERENHRIQVLNSDLTFSHFIGKPGRREGEFYLPGDLAIAQSSGRLYVADSGNHRVQVLNLDGSFIGSFGKKGSKPGELNLPSHLCVDSEGVYVSEEGNHRVSIFDLNGVFVRSIGGRRGDTEGQFDRPMGVAIDMNKTLYVCDSRNDRIQVFK